MRSQRATSPDLADAAAEVFALVDAQLHTLQDIRLALRDRGKTTANKNGSPGSAHSSKPPVSEEQALASINAEIRALRTRRNALTKICRLPPELLAHIFTIRALAHRTHSPREEWIVATHVCRHWRDIALACPTLWAVIHERFRAPQIRAYLRRSKNAPLQVTLPVCTNDDSTAWILAELPRIRSLYIMALPGLDSCRELVPFLESPAPMLEDFALTGCREPSGILLTLFGNQCPSLKTLYLDHVCVCWSGMALQGLSELTLLGIPIDCQPSLPELLSILEACRGLEVLRLKGAGPRTTSALHRTSPIALPRLRQLELHMSSATCLNLLDRVTLPAAVNVDLLCHDYPVGRAVPVLPPHVPRMVDELVLEVHLFADRVTIGALLTPPGTPERARIVDVGLRWAQAPRADAPHRDTFATLGTLLGTCGLARATQLYFCVDGAPARAVDRGAWGALLAALPRLRYLKTWYNRTDAHGSAETDVALARALAAREGPHGAFPCPALRTLGLVNFNFSRRRGRFCAELARCLTARRAQGVGLTTLNIASCNGVGPGVVGGLKALVDTVGWDGMAREEPG